VRCCAAGGQLGYADTENVGDNETPASAGDIDLGGSAVKIAAGRDHNCALLDTGAVRCWGDARIGRSRRDLLIELVRLDAELEPRSAVEAAVAIRSQDGQTGNRDGHCSTSLRQGDRANRMSGHEVNSPNAG